MEEKHLTEVASLIQKVDAPLVIISYLKEHHHDLLSTILNNPKYSEINDPYRKIKLFADDYLKDKEPVDVSELLAEFGYPQDKQEVVYSNDYHQPSNDYFYNIATANDPSEIKDIIAKRR